MKRLQRDTQQDEETEETCHVWQGDGSRDDDRSEGDESATPSGAPAGPAASPPGSGEEGCPAAYGRHLHHAGTLAGATALEVFFVLS